MKKESKIHVMIAPLDWGLGHATRCIPIINEFIRQNCRVTLAGDGQSLKLLTVEFPQLPYIRLKGYRIKFPGTKLLPFYFFWQFPQLIFRIIKEHYDLKKLIRKLEIDIVVSDNRYGLWNKNIYSVFLTHQLNIIPPSFLKFTSPLLRYITRIFTSKYNKCWVVDHAGDNNLSGCLSHGYKNGSNISYIGLLSRFEKISEISFDDTFDVVALVSGPEPQRLHFEKVLIEQLSNSGFKSLLVRGLPENQGDISVNGNLSIADHLTSNELFKVLNGDPVVVCRGGFSSLMDLAYTGNKIICIPTPGQTEQEYLSERCASNNWVVKANQESFIISECIRKVQKTTGLKHLASSDYAKEISFITHTLRK